MAVVRAGNLTLQSSKMQEMGLPIEGILDQSELPGDIMELPEALISLPKSIRFLDIAAAAAGTPDLGLLTGQKISIGDLGVYGQILDRSITVHDYLRLGIPLYSAHSNHEYFWLEYRGDAARLHHELILEPSLGTTQSDLNSFAIIIGKFREALGSNWLPGEISLAWDVDRAILQESEFGETKIITGTGHSYIALSRSELRARFPSLAGSYSGLLRLAVPDNLESVPDTLVDLVAMQIERLILNSRPNIRLLSETLDMPVRTLQHYLAQAGLSYRQLLGEARFRLATAWLAETEKTITQIAQQLAYRDTSNFSRAFRNTCGISPRAFRKRTFEESQSSAA